MAATLLDTREHLAPGYRPGERMVAGKPYVFNADLLNLHLAHEDVLSAPLDLRSLSYDALVGLMFKAGLVNTAADGRLPYRLDREASEALFRRVCDERATRPEYINTYGRAA